MIKNFIIIILVYVLIQFQIFTEDSKNKSSIKTKIDNNTIIEKINNEEITINKFERILNTALKVLSSTQNIEMNSILEILSTNQDDLDENLKPIHYQFQKKAFYESYKNILTTYDLAEKSGFTDRADIKEMMNYLHLQTISQLYITEEVNKKAKVSSEEAKSECSRLRKEDPRFKELSDQNCVKVGRAYIKENKTKEVLPIVLEKIKSQSKFKKNEKFDMEKYSEEHPLPIFSKN
ncbi:MAG: lipoprotein LipL31 [Leptospiraceae bacterium]|nr:lipoprotein LipL31 [Leptospiraceae bacterium]